MSMGQVDSKLPSGWSWKKFKDVCGLKRGYDLPTHARTAGKFPLYSANGVTDYIDQFKVNGPGVVTGRSGTIGKVHFVDGDYWPLNTALYVQKFNGNNPRFIKYFLQSFDLTRFASGAAVPTLNRNSLSAELVCTPDTVEEQKRIVDKLDAILTRIDAAIEHLQDSVSLKGNLLQSALDGQFAAITERMTIESIANVKGGKRLPKGEKLSDDVTEHPYIRVADFTDKGTIDLSNIKYISKEIHEQIKRYVISKDDLYISIAGTIGKTGFVPPEIDGANLTENAAKLVIKDKQQLDLSYLYLFTLTSDFSAQAGLATKTVAQPKLALTRLSKIEIPMCSLGEQKALVATIEALKSKIHDTEEVLLGKIKDLKCLKASILDSAFKGAL
ncbi:restriction endonuclease subunit S [Pseudoalteromonas sp. NZS100]|uniref:restriction endonuclease subunit S n=1 Tax=Pseudoalteromonas sp. NZS100 TaxID=2792046 RepID=UPI0018CE5CB1|nr:restriction endonuclease subunit S [Pseudoalteromonas sp. NZS100]MBH0067250.1 restriction endonuclease subunit S [Pseudoalteromonas sp. NZS100]